jgi:hypothetical protein
MIVLMRKNKVASWLHKLEMSGRLQAYYISLRRPERCFLTIYVICGMLFMIIIPPMQIADESSHFYRAYQVSTGGLISKITPAGVGGVLPSGIVEFTESANKNAISFQFSRPAGPFCKYSTLRANKLYYTSGGDTSRRHNHTQSDSGILSGAISKLCISGGMFVYCHTANSTG